MLRFTAKVYIYFKSDESQETEKREEKKHHGAAEARRAHNPEGTGSKPVGAKCTGVHFFYISSPSHFPKGKLKTAFFCIFFLLVFVQKSALISLVEGR